MILGFSGWPGVGKSTLVQHFLKMLPKYEKISFGDFLKEDAAEKFNFPLEWCYTPEGKANFVEIPNWPYPAGRAVKQLTVRELLQWYGSEYLFVNEPLCLVNRARANLRGRQNIVFDDMRDLNEMNFIRGLGGKVIRIMPFDTWSPGPEFTHPREHLLDHVMCWDDVLTPNFGELEKAAKNLIDRNYIMED